MRALRLHRDVPRLRLEVVPDPSPAPDGVVVRVAGSGLCHSDLTMASGSLDAALRFPVTLGHEVAGMIAAVGAGVSSSRIGESVVLVNGFGCRACGLCRAGRDQLCLNGSTGGSTADGGFADYIAIPHARYAVPLLGLDPSISGPLADAGLTSYAAIVRVAAACGGGRPLVIIGLGGLGRVAVQIARAQIKTTVLAVVRREAQIAPALALGASAAMTADEAVQGVGRRTAGAVIDFVGSDETLALAGAIVAPRGIIAIVGIAGGLLPLGIHTLAGEASVTSVNNGTVAQLRRVVEMARVGEIVIPTRQIPLPDWVAAFDQVRHGALAERLVLVP